MRKAISLKQQKVAALKERILKAKTVVSFDDLGLTVKESTDLRVQLNNESCQMTVYKNNISKRAFEAAGFAEIKDAFVGKKVLVFSDEDVIAPARIIYNFARKNKKVKLQVGVIEGKAATQQDVIALATLPSYETILTQLAAGLLMPLRELAIGLNLIAEQKQLEGEV